jgi:hypothetical protein
VETYEEWRLILDVGKKNALQVVEDLGRVPNGVDVHRRGDQLLVYAPSEETIREAERVIGRRLEQRGLTTHSALTRWNPGEERWQDPDLPVEPSTQMIGPEWAALGELGWEVRVRSQDGREARRLAAELSESGHPTVTGLGNRITVGVADRAAATALAENIKLEAPTARIETRPLSRWRRWLIRQRILGNYGAGGGDGGDFGGGGGNGGGG